MIAFIGKFDMYGWVHNDSQSTYPFIISFSSKAQESQVYKLKDKLLLLISYNACKRLKRVVSQKWIYERIYISTSVVSITNYD